MNQDFSKHMQVINSKGVVLLEVYSASATLGWNTFGERCFNKVTYQYKGPGIGGNVDLVGLHNTIKTIQLDSPSCKIIGFLPNPKLTFKH